MKSNILSACRCGLSSAALAGALFLSGGADLMAQPYASPLGTWDCVLSGGRQQGVACLTFFDDGTNRTFSGYVLQTVKQNNGGGSSGGRNPGGDVGRYTTADTNSLSASGNALFGFSPIDGPWQYDDKGRVIGYFIEVVKGDTCVTNIVVTPAVTNGTDVTLPQTNIVIDCGGSTNAVSFAAKVVSGKRLSLVSSTPTGKVTYKGVPYKVVAPGIGGSWYGTKREEKQDYLELFTLTSAAVSNPFVQDFPDAANYPNIYFSTNGTGPGFAFIAVSMVSSKKKIGFAFNTVQLGNTNATGGKISAAVGSLNSGKKGTKANTKGYEEPQPGVAMTFKGALQ